MFFQVLRNSSNRRRIGGAALNLVCHRCGAYPSKYGIFIPEKCTPLLLSGQTATVFCENSALCMYVQPCASLIQNVCRIIAAFRLVVTFDLLEIIPMVSRLISLDNAIQEFSLA